MIANFVYILVTIILLFVLYLAVKAITRGVEAKNDLKHEKDELENHQDTSNISNEISKLKKLYDEGALSEEEYKTLQIQPRTRIDRFCCSV